MPLAMFHHMRFEMFVMAVFTFLFIGVVALLFPTTLRK